MGEINFKCNNAHHYYIFDLQTNFKGFLDYLNDNRQKIGYIQLTGKMEKFLVKEFCYFIYTKSKGKYATAIDMGKKKEKRIDICVIAGQQLDYEQIEIVALIEAKYFRNWHRFFPLTDEDKILEIMKGFIKQIYPVEKDSHGWFNLNSSVKRVNAIAFASFVSYEQKDSKKEAYYTRILNTARKMFENDIISTFSFQRAYEDTEIELFNKKIYVTLRAGLWE